MKFSKSWKRELKKKGAMALTAFMLCGSFSTAFAQDLDLYSDLDSYSDPDSNSDSYSDPDSDSDSYSYSDLDSDSNSDSYSDLDSDSNSDSYSDLDSDSNSDSYSDLDSDLNSDSGSNQIIIVDGETGDKDLQDENSVGNIKTLIGYQTKKANIYIVNITWDNMEFVYDRGKYNVDTGNIEGSESVNNIELSELGRCYDFNGGANETTGVGYWYGMNNSSVKVENYSTKPITVNASIERSGVYELGDEEFGGVALHLMGARVGGNNNSRSGTLNADGTIPDVNEGTAIIWTLPNMDSPGIVTYGKSIRSYLGTRSGMTGEIETETGTIKYCQFYVNVSGMPKESWIDVDDYNSSTNKVEDAALGTITLSFSKAKQVGQGAYIKGNELEITPGTENN